MKTGAMCVINQDMRPILLRCMSVVLGTEDHELLLAKPVFYGRRMPPFK